MAFNLYVKHFSKAGEENSELGVRVLSRQAISKVVGGRRQVSDVETVFNTLNIRKVYQVSPIKKEF